jgi:excisionase family DNA binding protein
MEGYVTPRAAANLLAVSVKLIYKLAAARQLEVLKVGRSVRILAASLQQYIACNTVPKAEDPPPAASTPQPVTPPPSRPRRGKQKATGFQFLPPRPKSP